MQLAKRNFKKCERRVFSFFCITRPNNKKRSVLKSVRLVDMVCMSSLFLVIAWVMLTVFLAFVVTSLYPIQFFAQPLILVYISEGSFFLYLNKDKLFNSEERIYHCIILINRIFIEHNFFKTVFNMQPAVLMGRLKQFHYIRLSIKSALK